VDEVPMALAAFQGHLAAGIGKALRLYELGKKQLLRKCENNVSSISKHERDQAADHHAIL